MIMDFNISVRKMSVTKNSRVSLYFSHGNYYMCKGTGKMLEFQKLKKQDSVIYNTSLPYRLSVMGTFYCLYLISLISANQAVF